jgi:DNA-binding Lrp family transcriptional regulator
MSDTSPLDEVDRAILQLLQRDARNKTAVDIAAAIGVTDSTVRNRIEKLEEEGIIEGYAPLINYENGGFQLQVRFTCGARIVERERLAEEALDIVGVVEVREMMTGTENIEVTAVAPQADDLTRIALALDDLGLDVESEELIRHRYVRPFNHFGTEDASEGVPDDETIVHEV